MSTPGSPGQSLSQAPALGSQIISMWALRSTRLACWRPHLGLVEGDLVAVAAAVDLVQQA
eukprot:gene495-764_t